MKELCETGKNIEPDLSNDEIEALCVSCKKLIKVMVNPGIIRFNCPYCGYALEYGEENETETEVYGYIGIGKKHPSFITKNYKPERRPEPLKSIPKTKDGRPDLLKMQDNRERRTGIPKQTEQERQMQRALNDAFQ